MCLCTDVLNATISYVFKVAKVHEVDADEHKRELEQVTVTHHPRVEHIGIENGSQGLHVKVAFACRLALDFEATERIICGYLVVYRIVEDCTEIAHVNTA